MFSKYCNDMPHIRRALPDDAAEVARLTNELGYSASESVIAMRLAVLVGQPSHFVAVAQAQRGTLAGWISAERRLILESGERVEISGLVIDRTQRRQGIGRSLVEAVEQWTAQCGLASVVVRSNIERPESHAFYLSAGYLRSKTQHVYSKTLP
jgi:GNAT superfamily N-acetyltransferase